MMIYDRGLKGDPFYSNVREGTGEINTYIKNGGEGY